MKKLISLTALIYCVCVFSQKIKIIAEEPPMDSIPIYYEWFGKFRSKALSKDMNMRFYKPKEFMEPVSISNPFKNYPGLVDNISIEDIYIKSKDNEIIVFMALRPPMRNNVIRVAKAMNPKKKDYDLKNSQQSLQIQAVIRDYFDENEAKNWKKYVKYYPQKKAHSIFKADTALTYSIKLRPEDFYEGKYKHMKTLLLQKQDKGYAEIFCFYTDKAKANLKKYWKDIEQILQYRD